MLQQFQNHLSEIFPFLKDKKLLLAVSGGLDSMVLLHLFEQLKYNIVVLHCNFQLRGSESFGDQQFLQDYTKKHTIPFFFKSFDTKSFAQEHKLSTQLAARELRYRWFYDELKIQNGNYILTAHHADDNLETFLINLSRGTGLDGLTGIPAQNNAIIRPLLLFSRKEIVMYAKENQLIWREDSSNASDDYLRNRIRHHFIPILKDLHPNFIDSFNKTQSHLRETQALVKEISLETQQQVASKKGDIIYFDLKKLTQLTNYKLYLYQWLHEFDFTDWETIYSLVKNQSGKQIFSKNFCLLKDRDFLILSPLPSHNEPQEFLIEENDSTVNLPLNISFSEVKTIEKPSNTVIFVDSDKLQFPLLLRHWKKGDVFQPLGMEGKSKKVSKLFLDEKLSLLEKKKKWILCSNNQIVWVIGIRQDHRFKKEITTKNLLKIEIKS